MHERIEKLLLALKNSGIKQYDFAKKIGVTEAAVSAWKNGRRNITEQTLRAICREFNVDYMWLTTGEGEMFINLPETIIDELCTQYNLNEDDKRLILSYITLDEETRRTIIQSLKNTFLK